MRGGELLDKMELVEAAYVTAADAGGRSSGRRWVRWAALAACVGLTVYAGYRLFPGRDRGESSTTSDLPMLSVAPSAGGMGFEGYMAHDVSELVNANPWNEDVQLSTLPVFSNPITYDEVYHLPSCVDLEKMRALLLDVAGRLGLDPDALTVTDDAPGEEAREQMTEKLKLAGIDSVPDGYFDPTLLKTQAEGLDIEVDAHLSAKITFDPAVILPEEYTFAHDASYEEICAVADYLKNEYASLIGMQTPQADVSGGDYNIYGQQSYSVAFFDAAGDETDRILAYNFDRVRFACDDEGKLFVAWVQQPDLSQKVGDYPIITAQQAAELLEEGRYITTVPYEMPGMEYVEKVELVYRTGSQEMYFMPYYRFYVELPQETEGDMNTYGAYYVPAVSPEYISDMPVWDGRFN